MLVGDGCGDALNRPLFFFVRLPPPRLIVWKVKCVYASYKSRPEPQRPDTAPLEGLALTALYFLYLQMVKNSITMFHCVSNSSGEVRGVAVCQR